MCVCLLSPSFTAVGGMSSSPPLVCPCVHLLCNYITSSLSGTFINDSRHWEKGSSKTQMLSPNKIRENILIGPLLVKRLFPLLHLNKAEIGNLPLQQKIKFIEQKMGQFSSIFCSKWGRNSSFWMFPLTSQNSPASALLLTLCQTITSYVVDFWHKRCISLYFLKFSDLKATEGSFY